MDISTQLLQAMLLHGYNFQVLKSKDGIAFTVSGPGFAGNKVVQDYVTAVGLAAYWISETNGVPNDAKQAIDAILYRRIKKGHRVKKASMEHPDYQNTVTLAFAYELEDKLDTALDLLRASLKEQDAKLSNLPLDIKTFLDSEP